MGLYYPPWNNNIEPSRGNVRQWLDNLYAKFQPIEQSRWNQSNIDTLFYAGAQTFNNRNYGSALNAQQSWYFNICQQPVNMVTGYQRQHRKSINYTPTEGADPQTTDQYTRVITHVNNAGSIQEQFSKACELAAISGMVLIQPYLDFTGDDGAQGCMKLKIWEYNSFLVDPYFRSPDMSDAQFFWTQEYISKQEAEDRFPDKTDMISPMSGAPQRYGSFYFLPENYNMARNDLMVLSYVWYKWKTKRKRLYSRTNNQFYDFAQNESMEEVLYNIRDLEVVTVDVSSWKLVVVLNDQLMFQGENPLGTIKCPAIPVYWNYEPHINYFDLRVRGLIRPMRDPQYLFNHKVVQNNDIAAATINQGWKRKVGAVANEDNLKKSGQGYDIVINEGYELTDCEKILPTAVPQSDLELAEQMKGLMYDTSGINLENWSGQDDKQVSSLTVLLKQAANLMVFQKYFDQWDYSLKLLGELELQIVLNNWNAEKVKLYIGEEPTAHFYSKIFAKYQVIVEEGLMTPTQKNLQAQQMMDINTAFGREVIPPSMIIKDMNIQGKTEIVEFLKKQEEQMQQMQQEKEHVAHLFEDAKIKELYSKATANIARAREDHSRSESNLGLYEERLSMIERNRSMSLTEKQKALTALLENIKHFGEMETEYAENKLSIQNFGQKQEEEAEKKDVEKRTGANKFLAEIMGQLPLVPNIGQEQGQPPGQQEQQMASQNMQPMQ